MQDLYPSSQEKQLLQKSRKKYISCKIGEFESKSRKIFKTKKNANFARILQDLGRNKLSLSTLHSDNLCI